jgi:hypothetical protein
MTLLASHSNAAMSERPRPRAGERAGARVTVTMPHVPRRSRGRPERAGQPALPLNLACTMYTRDK